MINQTAKKILKALSFDGVEVEAFRHMADLKRLDPMKIFYKKVDEKIYNGSHAVPVSYTHLSNKNLVDQYYRSICDRTRSSLWRKERLESTIDPVLESWNLWWLHNIFLFRVRKDVYKRQIYDNREHGTARKG